jgi:hypothetical protein
MGLGRKLARRAVAARFTPVKQSLLQSFAARSYHRDWIPRLPVTRPVKFGATPRPGLWPEPHCAYLNYTLVRPVHIMASAQSPPCKVGNADRFSVNFTKN